MALSVQIQKRLGDFALDVDFQTNSRRIGILGRSGCGKSMTLKSIAGIEKPDNGKIIIDKRIFYDSEKRIFLKPQKRKTGYLFQNYALFPTMTVEKNLLAGTRCGRGDRERIVRQMVERFRLTGLEKRFPHELSGGQQQRVALARIMASEPELILLDEPFSALDLYLRDALQQEMEELLQDYKGIVILVSHSRDEIYRFSDEIVVLEEGSCLCKGGKKELFSNPVYEEAARLTGCKNFSEIRKIDSHTFLALDWNVAIHTKKQIPEDATVIGYRAHDFIPVWDKDRREGEEGLVPLELLLDAQLPFEQNYYFRLPGQKEQEHAGRLCWFVQREQERQIKEKGLPDYLKIDEERILFLKKWKKEVGKVEDKTK